jgi:hypothetical protein
MNVSKLIYAVAAVGFSASMAHATTTLVAVNGTSGPWEQSVNPTLNYGVHDNLAPTSVSSGYDFAPGGVFTFTYVSELRQMDSGARLMTLRARQVM